MDIVKFVPLVDGIVDLSQFEIKLKNRKDKLKIFRADDQSLKDRKRPLFAGPAVANDTEPLKENSRQVEKFVENIIRSKDQLSQIKNEGTGGKTNEVSKMILGDSPTRTHIS